MSVYQPSAILNHVNGTVWDVETTVDLYNGESLNLENNVLNGATRTITYRVVGDAEDDTYTAEETERVSQAEDETTVVVEIKKDGKIKGNTSRSYD